MNLGDTPRPPTRGPCPLVTLCHKTVSKAMQLTPGAVLKENALRPGWFRGQKLAMTEMKYNPQEIERKWQERWAKDTLYKAKEDSTRPKYYSLTMFPYTSGDLHIGHWYAMAPSDVHSRFKLMQGYNVMHPMGFDAFGLPAENAAINHGIHPFSWTMDNIQRMRVQLRSLGAIYDWDREVITCLPEYYKWNQWLFLQFLKKGLAYRAKAPANWCPSCQTVLANEQVVNGSCERCGTEVTRKEMEQWFFRITQYADELLDVSRLDWPEKVKLAQVNWIGRSEGAEINFDISEYGLTQQEIRVFTTRADTVYGVTFMVLAPEHPLVNMLTQPQQRSEVEAYAEKAKRQTEIERLAVDKEKTGVFIGAYCVNRLNGQRVPIFIADYALLSYGTGAVMGVPAHDTRDFAFAKRYGLPIPVVIAPPNWDGTALSEAYTEPGVMVNSGPFNGLPSQEGMMKVAEYLSQKGWGKPTVSYRLRDWLISRQRYWGTPIPIVYCPRDGIVPIPEEQLPVLLPEDAEFKPTGESPLKSHPGFINTSCPKCGASSQRESDTMDTFVDSAWYQFRYASPAYQKGPTDPEKARFWCPVDIYTGGAEHATKHLLYARFIGKAMRDLGLLDFDEPFTRLYCQGIILGEDHEKMSKSRGNVVNPDEYVSTLGADAIRCFLMFVGPWDQGGSWSSTGVSGIARWLNRVWDMAQRDPQILPAQTSEADLREVQRWTHRTVKRVTTDLERFRFNTMLAALMEFCNFLSKGWEDKTISSQGWRQAMETLLLLMAPSAPHLAEELWERAGHSYSIHNHLLPKWDEALAADEEITLVVQINGKVRDKLVVPASISEEEAREMALSSPKARLHLDNQRIARVIYVPGKLVSIVTG